MPEQDLTNVLFDLLVQLPVLAAVWLMFIRPMTTAHQESIEHYRTRQKELDEWMRRMMEVWSGERLDMIDAQALKKIEPAQTETKPTNHKTP